MDILSIVLIIAMIGMLIWRPDYLMIILMLIGVLVVIAGIFVFIVKCFLLYRLLVIILA